MDFSVLFDNYPIRSVSELFQHCSALENLHLSGIESDIAMEAVLRCLIKPVSLDARFSLQIAAATAAWRIGRYHDLALPIFAWALKDRYWGYAYNALHMVIEMGSEASHIAPELVRFANQRLAEGRFQFERDDQECLLSLVSKALGKCGNHMDYCVQVRETLQRIAECDVSLAAAAATESLKQLPMPPTWLSRATTRPDENTVEYYQNLEPQVTKSYTPTRTDGCEKASENKTTGQGPL